MFGVKIFVWSIVYEKTEGTQKTHQIDDMTLKCKDVTVFSGI